MSLYSISIQLAQMMCRQILKPTLFCLCIYMVTAIHFCFLKQPSSQNIKSSANLDQEDSQSFHNGESKLKSYHPHYLISLSYAHPITPHIYYGQVVGSTPIFLYSDVQRWHPQSISTFTINGFEYTDASVKSFLLRSEQQFRYMFVLQIENAFEREIGYKINVFKRKDHFFILCSYQDKKNGFALYFTKKDKVLQLNSDLGVQLGVRNESGSSAKDNWQFSRRVRWIGDKNINFQSENFTGFVLQIQYNDKNILHSTKLNLKEIEFDQNSKTNDIINHQPAAFSKKVKIANKEIVKHQNCAQAAYQKLFDGLSYQYGTLQIRDRQQVIPNQPKSLLSFSPSRKRFPWGFLWDDGFHCQVAVRKDPKLVIEVLKSWLDTMLDSGWIPRQQNRGVQREQLCSCPRFMAKDVRDGNPPTLVLSLDYLRRKNLLTNISFPGEYWKKLKKWYKWFMDTQKDTDAYLFKWHDSLNQQGASFTSGMDDFPRPMLSKAHVDLQTWMYFFTKFMVQTAHIYGENNLIKNNFKFFVDPADHTFRDISIDQKFSEYYGYPNILPLAFGIPDYKSSEYNATIKKVIDELDIEHGLASISKLSPFYLSNNDAYWRGPVWININYLFLRGLKLYYPNEASLYLKLRNDLLSTVCGNWQRTGHFYENYIKGVGSFGYPFNGWTSLIALIQEQNY